MSATTVSTIKGNQPTFSAAIISNIDDFSLFGITIDGQNYYDSNVTNLLLSNIYPFKDRVTIAPVKKPDNGEYVDLDGDEVETITPKDTLKMEWFYTDSRNKLVSFVPKDTDSFCSLFTEGKTGPYKIKISGDVILSTKYGDPNQSEFSSTTVQKQPSKIYTLSEDAGICYAKPELKPTEASSSGANIWNAQNGFLVQSNTDPTKNFPTTGFYGAKFDLIFAKAGLAEQYDWTLTQGDKLVNITPNSDTVTVSFTTEDAKDPQAAWNYVIGSGIGYTVNIQGRHKTKGYIVQYPFTITKWFTSWDKTTIGTGNTNVTTAAKVAEGCLSIPGTYRISYTNELSNAPYVIGDRGAKFTRERGTLLSEWGDATQKNYPNSWAAAPSKPNTHRRLWLYDPSRNNYCDLHTYDAIYHCIDKNGSKNGVCSAVLSR